MSKRFDIGFKDPKGILIHKPGVGGILAEGTSVPANGTTDYAPGCVFVLDNGTLGASFYINQGSATSCTFVPMPDLTTFAGGGGSANIYTLTTTTAATVISSKPTGSLFLLGAAAGFTVTMPAATGSGNIYSFVTSVTVTSSVNLLDFKTGGATIQGICCSVQTTNAGTSYNIFGTASNTNEISMNGSTSGGVIGDFITVRDIATNVFQLMDCNMNSTGTAITPFANH